MNSELLELISQMQLDPRTFQSRWDLEIAQIAQLCCTSTTNVYHWRGEGSTRREIADSYKRIVALTDLLLENNPNSLIMVRRWCQFR
ncbi:MAG: hypothetical protein WBB43_19350 [Limnoraphis sp.]